MDDNNALNQLEELAQGLNIKIRYESMKKEGSYSAGGLCMLKGEYLLIVNSRASIRDKIEIIAKAVNNFELDHVYLRPGLRERLDSLE